MAALAAAAMGVACSDATTGRVGLAVATRAAPGGALSPALAGWGPQARVTADGDSIVVALGNDTVIIRGAEVVLRKIELERVEATAGCEDLVDDGACEEVDVGPRLVALPLGNAIETVITAAVPAGTYDELEFEVHKPDDDTPDDLAFLAAHPDFRRISIRVSGTFSQGGARTDFTFMSDLNEKQEVELFPFLEVIEGESVNLTLRLDLATWFLDASRTGLVDPASANKGGPNENLVRDNIRASIDAFRDDDHDGLDDDQEGS